MHKRTEIVKRGYYREGIIVEGGNRGKYGKDSRETFRRENKGEIEGY